MKRYLKKPLIVEAIKLDQENLPELLDISEHNTGISIIIRGDNNKIDHATIHTPEGMMRGDAGDYLVCDNKGYWYACKPHIFEQSYDPE